MMISTSIDSTKHRVQYKNLHNALKKGKNIISKLGFYAMV